VVVNGVGVEESVAVQAAKTKTKRRRKKHSALK